MSGVRTAPEMRRGYLIGLASGLVWGLSAVFVGIAVDMSPFAAAGLAVAPPLAAAGLYDGLRALWQMVYLLARGRVRVALRGLRGRGLAWAVLAAVAGGPFATSCFFLSIALVGVTYAYTVSAISPALGAVLAAVFLGERLPARAWGGMSLVVAGAAVVSYQAPQGASSHFFVGVAFALVTAVAWAIEALFAAKALHRVDADAVNAVRQGLSFLLFLAVVFPLVGAYGTVAEALRSPSLLVLVGSAAVGSLGFLLYFRAVGAIGPSRAMPINLTYVLWASLFSLLITGARPTWQLLAGGVLIIAGTPLVALQRRRALAVAAQAEAD